MNCSNKRMKGVILLLCFSLSAFAQDPGFTPDEIRQKIEGGKADSAALMLNQQLNWLFTKKSADTITTYVQVAGMITAEKSNPDNAIKTVKELIAKISGLNSSPEVLKKAWVNAAQVFEDYDRNKAAYEADTKALEFARLTTQAKPVELANLEYTLGVYAQRLGNAALSQLHHRNALKQRESFTSPDYESLYLSYNAIGSIMYYASKTDSALLFFKKALDAIGKLDSNAYNRYFRPAIIQNNLSGLYTLQGKMGDATEALKITIKNIRLFLESPEEHPKKKSAVSFEFQAIDNLAGIYKELGNYSQAKALLQHSYQQKKNAFDKDSPEIFKSEILLGQLYYAMREYDKARDLLLLGLPKAMSENGDLFFAADAAYGLAILYDQTGDKQKAAEYFTKSEQLYEQSYNGEYDNIFLEFMRNAAQFYAENNEPQRAIALAKKSYDYVVETSGENSLLPFYQTLNLSQVYFLSGMNKEALQRSEEAIQIVDNKIKSGNGLLDSVLMEIKKPGALLLRSKIRYRLLAKKDAVVLQSILSELNQAVSVLERRKSVLSDAEDISLLMADHQGLLDFIKVITIDLYELTGDEKYIGQLLSVHESGIYQRIRSRLDKNNAIRFNNVPQAILEKENKLRSELAGSFTNGENNTQRVKQYLKASENWDNFLNDLRKNYPGYYNMRYAAIIRPVDSIKQNIPADRTIIRYIFSGDKLYALVMQKNKQTLIKLNAEGLDKKIAGLNQSGMNAKLTGQYLSELYEQLWKPLNQQLNHSKILIVPDGILFNLSFESLTPAAYSDFRSIATNCLLNKLNISYHYSLLLTGLNQPAKSFKNNFVAFAPGFSDEVKQRYLSETKDSLELDKSYLSLLPLPFTINLVNKTKDVLGGETFVSSQSTLPVFKANAGQYRILHIGTHAESNNLHPEYSRLIFAKNDRSPSDSNSLFLYDIYNCDLGSELTVLTACETGKPGFEDGEGMISLGHAFNYAGSQSILTSLWKIDEQSSTQITELFYQFLNKGLPKDEALRQAKLSYIQQSDGRMLAPQYWAGLVLIGEQTPVGLEKKTKWMWWGVGLMLIAVVAVMAGKSKEQKNAA
jgi:CHAT domain-containing protein